VRSLFGSGLCLTATKVQRDKKLDVTENSLNLF